MTAQQDPDDEPVGISLIGKRPFEEALPALARHGYRAVDYSTSTPQLIGDADLRERVRALTRELGLAPAGTHSRSFDRDFLLPGARREAFLRESVEEIRAAAYLGVPAVAFHLGVDLATKGGGTDAEVAAANAEVYREAVRVAEQEGVCVALENVYTGWGHRWEHLEAVAALLDSPAVGFTLDSGHAVIAGYRAHDLARKMGARLALTHLHDNEGTKDIHRPAGRTGPNGDREGGVIDWPALIAALREVGYLSRNVWMIEGGMQVPGDDPDRLLEVHMAAFTAQLARSSI